MPLQKAGIVLDYKAPRSIFEWLADAQHVGANNPNNLPAYTTFDAGVTAQLTRGTLTFAATNITNTYSGIFASPANAVPYTTAGGYTIANIARPLVPRTYSLTYSARFGQGVLSSQMATAFHARGAGGGSGALGGAGSYGGPPPGGPGAPGGQGGGRGFQSLFSPLPQTPPGDPFVVGANPTTCSAQNAVESAATLDRTQSIRRANRSCTNGSRLSGHDARAVAARCNRHVSRPRYDVRSRDYAQGHGHAARAGGCMSLHIARADDVTQRKLYAPSSPLFFVPQLNFMPAVGLYFVARQPQAGQEMFRVYKLRRRRRRSVRGAHITVMHRPSARTSQRKRSTS